jgi:hypothetical protein
MALKGFVGQWFIDFSGDLAGGLRFLVPQPSLRQLPEPFGAFSPGLVPQAAG